MYSGQFSGRLTIDLGAIARNWAGLDRVSATALTGAVVKANAYGCGLPAVSHALHRAGAQFFFVATPEEGLALRETLPDVHIFVFNGLPPGAARLFAEHRLMPVLNSMAQLDQWLALCVEAGEALPAAFHFDTGINRLGFRLTDASIVRQRMDESGYLPQMIMSHLACADQPSHEKNRTQRALFQSLLTMFPDIPASLANSAGTLAGRENHFQMVRPGIALYGARAVNGRPNPMSVAVTVEVPILQVREARTGETVGYGATQALNRDSRLATLAVGYADGFFRHLSSTGSRPGGKVAINGQLVPIVGRVSMDLTVVDITDLPEIPAPGSFAEVYGPNVPIDEQADAAGTIGYELLTALQGRYQRFYRSGDGEVVQG